MKKHNFGEKNLCTSKKFWFEKEKVFEKTTSVPKRKKFK